MKNMNYKLYNISGKETDNSLKLNKDVYGIKPNEHSIYLTVKSELASNRQGTGSNANSLRTNGADGGMGPLKIYNRALTSTEVKPSLPELKH